MNRITSITRSLCQRGEGAFMPFIVAGDPDLDTTLAIAGSLVEAGADILELGFPFSDPPADGKVIEAASRRALAGGTTPALAFELLDQMHRRWHKPTALLLYYNIVLQYGVDAFYARAAEAGVDAILVADVPLEEADDLIDAGRHHGVAPVFIVSERTPEERLVRMRDSAEGYLYLVARLGITGERRDVNPELAATISRIKRLIDLPVLVGFGISEPAHVHAVRAAGADGVICGSAIVRRIAEHASDQHAMLKEIHGFAAAMKAATRARGAPSC